MLITIGILLSFHVTVTGQLPADSPRLNPFVRVVQQVQDAVLPIYIQKQGGIGSGSAAIFHTDGYALTNDHVVKASNGVAVRDGKLVKFVVVGRSPEKDLAVIRLESGDGAPWPCIPLSRSEDVLNGESVAVLGNPGGRGTVVTAGVVSSKAMYFPPISAFAMTYFPNSLRERFLQYDAATNLGNSGGPVVNMDGELIGIVAALVNQEQNTSFAIPVNRVRDQLPVMIAPELSHQRWVGIRVDQHHENASVESVEPDSPAAKAGVQEGDVILSVGETKMNYPSDWLVTLDRSLGKRKSLDLILQRDEAQINVSIETASWPSLEAAEVDQANPGVRYDFYQGEFEQLPKFDELQPVRSGLSDSISLKSVVETEQNRFAVRFYGFLQVEKDGLYRIIVGSDDGTRVKLHSRVLIDHDGIHPHMRASQLVRLKAGPHPLTVEYFQKTGDRSLEFRVQQLARPAEYQTTDLNLRLQHSEFN